MPDVEYSAHDQSPPSYNQGSTTPKPSAISYKRSNERQREDQNESGETNPFLSWCKRYETPINLFCAISVAIFTGLLIFYTVKLWSSGEKHSERELRAYVGVTEVTTEGFGIRDQVLSVLLTMKNSGQTPAYDVTIERTFDLYSVPRTEFQRATITQPEQSRSTIGPGVEVDSGGSARRPFSQQEFDQLARGEIAMFFFGRIEYVDAFKKKRFTDFRYFSRLRQGRVEWCVAEEGNDST